jgi:hypothetical protein
VRADPRRGEHWLRQAAEQGWASALGELERYWFAHAERLMAAGDVEKHRPRAANLYRQAAELGHRQSAWRYGSCLRLGWGVPADAAEARLWLRKASSLPDAQLALADMLLAGEGGAANPVEAFAWYERAVRQGDDPYAMYSLGYCLLNGVGVAADPKAGCAGCVKRPKVAMVMPSSSWAWLMVRRTSGAQRTAGHEAACAAAQLGHARALEFLSRLEPADESAKLSG